MNFITIKVILRIVMLTSQGGKRADQRWMDQSNIFE